MCDAGKPAAGFHAVTSLFSATCVAKSTAECLRWPIDSEASLHR